MRKVTIAITKRKSYIQEKNIFLSISLNVFIFFLIGYPTAFGRHCHLIYKAYDLVNEKSSSKMYSVIANMEMEYMYIP